MVGLVPAVGGQPGDGDEVAMSYDILERIFAPEAVLPEQLTNDIHKRSPTELLMLAVLEDGLVTIWKNHGATKPRRVAMHREAMHWLRSNDTSWPFAFATICTHFGFDVDAVRESVLRRTMG